MSAAFERNAGREGFGNLAAFTDENVRAEPLEQTRRRKT